MSSTASVVNESDFVKPHIATLVVGSWTLNLLSLALPLVTLQIYDRIIPNSGTGTLYVLVGGLGVVVLLEVILRLSRAYMIGLSGAAYAHGMTCRAMRHIMSSDGLGTRSADIADDYHSLSAVKSLKDLHNGEIQVIWIDLAFVPILLGLIAYIGGDMVFISIGLLIIFTLLSMQNGRKLHDALVERDKCDDQRFNLLISSLNAVHTVKAFALERILQRRQEDFQAKSSQANHVASLAINTTINHGHLFAQLITALTIAYGAWKGINEVMTIGAIIACVQLSGRLMQPIQRGLFLWTRYQDLRVAQARVNRLFETSPVVSEPAEAIPQNDGHLKIEGLNFRFNEDSPAIFNGVDLEIEKGSAVSISGPAGSGKTLLLKLIAGMHRPTSGTISINGLETTRFPPAALSRHVGYMSAEGIVFRGTIRDNITRFGEISSAQAMEIAEHMELHRDITALPGGLETKLDGLASDSIPPGLRQRIAILRALVSKPRILLFDNADKALDVNGYNQVYRLLGRLKSKTSMIIISEDENLRGLADRHYALDDGKLVETNESESPVTRLVPYRELRL